MAGVGKRAFGRWCACVSRGRCGARWPPDMSRRWIRGRRGKACTQRAFRVAGVGNGATGGLAGHRFARQAQGIVRGS